MSIRCDTADYINRTTNLPNWNGTYTIMGWFYFHSFPGNFIRILVIHNTDYTKRDAIRMDSEGDIIVENEAVDVGNLTRLSTNTWYHITMLRSSSTSLKVYVDGVLGPSDDNFGNVGTSRGTPDHLVINNVVGFSVNGNISVDCIKVWDGVALSVAEIFQEMHSKVPRRFTNLQAWYPCFPGSGERVKDYGGNGYNWSESGTVTDADPPPVSYGASIYPINLSAPEDVILFNPVGSQLQFGTRARRR